MFQEQTFYNMTNSKYSKIEDQISAWLEKNKDEEFAEPTLGKVLESITDEEPGISLLSEKNRKNYHKEIKGYLTGKMKNGKTFNRKEMKDLLVRFLLKFTNPNSELDILIFLKVTRSSRSLVLVMVSFKMLGYCWFGVHLSTGVQVNLFV